MEHKKDFEVIENIKLSGKYEKRYIIVSKETGKVLDDAQGYGYKSKQKAYAAYTYKNRNKEEIKKHNEKQKEIKNWCKENKEFCRLVDTIAFEVAKGSWGPDDKMNAKLLKKLLKDSGYTNLPFTPGEFLKYYFR